MQVKTLLDGGVCSAAGGAARGPQLADHGRAAVPSSAELRASAGVLDRLHARPRHRRRRQDARRATAHRHQPGAAEGQVSGLRLIIAPAGPDSRVRRILAVWIRLRRRRLHTRRSVALSLPL